LKLGNIRQKGLEKSALSSRAPNIISKLPPLPISAYNLPNLKPKTTIPVNRTKLLPINRGNTPTNNFPKTKPLSKTQISNAPSPKPYDRDSGKDSGNTYFKNFIETLKSMKNKKNERMSAIPQSSSPKNSIRSSSRR
jgi:hypothetical protein